MRERKRETWTKWRDLISDQGRSGRTVAAFCRERGLAASQFFAWKKRLRQAAAGQFVEVQIAVPGNTARPAAAYSRAIEIWLGDSRSVFVDPGFDAEHLRAVLAVLESCA